MDLHTIQALVRFGLGRRGDSPLPTDPVAWLHGQIEADDEPFPANLPTTADGLTVLREQFKLKLPGRPLTAPLHDADVQAQTARLLTTEAPFRERLVWFWANHFTVSIRPNVTGPFFAMLLAVMQHPAMLMYLDNNNSIGPNSAVGRSQARGLNENLARECLELHTLGADGGYTQADVTEFAKVISGWSVDLNRLVPGFQFRPGAHEPGPKTLMGHRFPPGEPGGVAALEFLAHHPATYRHLATRLATHFVADTPPPEAVRAIEGALSDTRGDLGAAAAALLGLDAAWTPLAKLRTPQDYAVATLRALDLPPDQVPLAPALAGLGQPLWTAPLPNGWADDAAGWAGPEAMMRRIDWSHAAAARAGNRDPAEVADAALGPLLRPQTRAALRAAGSRQDALTLLLTSPEFQRR